MKNVAVFTVWWIYHKLLSERKRDILYFSNFIYAGRIFSCFGESLSPNYSYTVRQNNVFFFLFSYMLYLYMQEVATSHLPVCNFPIICYDDLFVLSFSISSKVVEYCVNISVAKVTGDSYNNVRLVWGWMPFLIHDQRQMCQYYSRSGTCRSLTLSLLVLTISYQCCTSSYCWMLMLYSFRGTFHKPSLRPK